MENFVFPDKCSFFVKIAMTKSLNKLKALLTNKLYKAFEEWGCLGVNHCTQSVQRSLSNKLRETNFSIFEMAVSAPKGLLSKLWNAVFQTSPIIV